MPLHCQRGENPGGVDGKQRHALGRDRKSDGREKLFNQTVLLHPHPSLNQPEQPKQVTEQSTVQSSTQLHQEEETKHSNSSSCCLTQLSLQSLLLMSSHISRVGKRYISFPPEKNLSCWVPACKTLFSPHTNKSLGL